MVEYIDEKNQMENVHRFRDMVSKGHLDIALISISYILHKNLEDMMKIKIDGRQITEYKIYDTHQPIFMEISEKTINRYDTLNAFGFSNQEIEELKNKNPDKEKIKKMFSDRLGIILDDKIVSRENKKIEILENLSNRVTPETNQKIVESLYYSNDEINKILNGIKDYMDIDSIKKPNKKLKKYLSFKLYSDAFEIYLKVLKEIYSKFEKIKTKDIDNKKMYKFFNDKYPILLESTNNKLRNDICHLNYKERENYTLEQIDEERNIILVKAITGIIVRNIFITDFFDKHSKIEEKANTFLESILKEIKISEEDKNKRK